VAVWSLSQTNAMSRDPELASSMGDGRRVCRSGAQCGVMLYVVVCVDLPRIEMCRGLLDPKAERQGFAVRAIQVTLVSIRQASREGAGHAVHGENGI